MAKYRKKPVFIEAMQWTGKNTSAVQAFGRRIQRIFDGRKLAYLLIHTLKGEVAAYKNDWIIRGEKGEFYPVKNNIFLETYEPVK